MVLRQLLGQVPDRLLKFGQEVCFNLLNDFASEAQLVLENCLRVLDFFAQEVVSFG